MADEHIIGNEGRLTGNLNCPCGCRMALEQPMISLLKSITREIGDIYITSGARCEKHNMKVGGKKNSAHILGKAVEVATLDARIRYKVIKSILGRGVKRVGWGGAEKFLHFDIATGAVPYPTDTLKEYPQDVAWDY